MSNDKKEFIICSFCEIGNFSKLISGHASRIKTLNQRPGKTVFPRQSSVIKDLLKFVDPRSGIIHIDKFENYLDKKYGKILIQDPVM